MFINCFLVLMILSQNIPSPTEAKPYFTKIHRLNSVRDFDDIVDWTCNNQNVRNQKQEPKGSKQTTDNLGIQERSVSSEATSRSVELIEKRSDFSTYFDAEKSTEKMQVSMMPSPPSSGTEKMEASEMPSKQDRKEDRKRSEVEEIKDVVDENEDNREEFGEGFSNLYKKMRNKMKKKKCKTCLTNIEEELPMRLEDIEDEKSKVKYILPYRRSAPMCLLNDRNAAAYYQTAVPVIRPVLMSAPQPIYIQGSPNDDRSPLYEVEWLPHPSVYRKRREIDNWYPKRAYPFMVDRECDHNNDKVSQAHKELVCMIRAVKSEFLNKNNLTFLPILFVPHCDGTKPCPEIPGSAELGQLSFQNVDPSNMKEKEEEPHQCCNCHPKDPTPPKGKNNEPLCINIGHMTIILLANNTLSVVFPAPGQEPEIPETIETPEESQRESQSQRPDKPSQPCCPPPPKPCCPPPPSPPQPEPVCFPPCPSPCPCPYPCRASEKNGQFKRNVIDNLKQYLENAFNFIDIRRVLTEDELHDRTSRDTLKRFGSDIIPGILLYPKRYGPTLAKSSREATNFDFEESDAPISDFYCLTPNGNAGGKFKRSLNSKKVGISEGDIAAEEAQLEIEKKQAQLEKEMQIDLNLDKEVVEALNVASTTASLAAAEQMKKDEEYLEKENQEMIRNEQLLEAPDAGDEPTEQTCVFTEPLITEEIEPISSATDSVIESMSAEASAMAEAGRHLDDVKGPEAEELEATEEALTETPVECPDPCPPEECCEREPCQPEDEPCPPPCNEPTPPCHLPTSDEIGVNQTDLAKGKASKSVAEFENEMLGIIDSSKKENLANEEKRKGVFDITTKHTWKVKKKRKSKKIRGLRSGRRSRRDLKATDPSSSGWTDATSTTTSKMAVRDVETETTELVKVTPKETTSPAAICEEVEDVTEVLFTTKPSQEQMELECNEVKEAEVTPKSTTQKLGVPITIVITKSTEAASTTTEIPSVLSEFIQPPLRDENDETVTEKLNRLLRDLGLVKQVQSFLQGIKETGYEIRDAVRRRTQRETSNDIGGLVTGRKLFSMEVHPKYSETKGPLQQFRRRTYRRRSGENFKRYSRGIDENAQNYPENRDSERISSRNDEEIDGSEKRRRWRKYAGNWVDGIASFFTSNDNEVAIGDDLQKYLETSSYNEIENEGRNLPPESKLSESDLLLYDDQEEYAKESRRKRSFTVSNDAIEKSLDDASTTQKHKDRRASPSKDDLELGEISNALEEMMSTNYQLEKPKTDAETSSIDELMTPIEEFTTTERHFTRFHLKVEENFKDILDIEKSLDTTLPPSTETTMSPLLLTEIPQISEKPFEVVTTLDELLATVPSPTTYRAPTVDALSIFDDLDEEVKVSSEDGSTRVTLTTTCKASSADPLSSFDDLENEDKVSVQDVPKIKNPIKMLKKWLGKKETTSTQRTTTTTERKKMLTTNQDEVMYPLEIETLEPKEEVEDEVPCGGGGECDISSTTPECAFTAKGRIAHDEIRDNETEYYVDIIIPYDTDEQQQYIDRFVQEEPSYDRRVQREDAERKLWKEFKWPEHRKYEGVTAIRGSEGVDEKEAPSSESDDREIWKEFEFPERGKYESTTAGREIVITENGGIGKTAKSDSPNEPEGSLASTEDRIDDAEDTAEDREIWKEFKWPDRKIYESPNVDSLITTQRELEDLDNVEEIDWSENKGQSTFRLSSTEKSTTGDWGKNIWREFKWPEHKKYGGKAEQSTIRESQEMDEYGTMTFSSVATETVTESSVQDYESGLGIPEIPNLSENLEWLPHTKASTEIGAKPRPGPTEGSTEWSEFNTPSLKTPENTEKNKGGYDDLPAKKKMTLPEGASANTAPMDESEAMTDNVEKADGSERFKWSKKPKVPTSEGPHVMKTGLWEELHVPVHDSAHLKVIPASTSWTIESTTYDRLARSTNGGEKGLWNRFQWPEHRKYVSSEAATENVELMETAIWNKMQKSAHFRVVGEATESNAEEEAGGWRKFKWPSHNEYAEGGTTKTPLVMEKVIWDKLHIPNQETAHVKIVNDSGPMVENKEVGAKTPQPMKTTRNMENTESGDEVLPHFGGDLKHTTKIIEKSFTPDELTTKTYIVEGSDKKTTTDIWEAFQWPPPRTPPPENKSEVSVEGETFGPLYNLDKMDNLPWISDSDKQQDKPDSSLDLFSFPSHDAKTPEDNLTVLDIPVPPFPPSEDYDEYSMLKTTDSSWPYNDANLFSELNLPQEMSSTSRDSYADLMDSLGLSSEELFPSFESTTEVSSSSLKDSTSESDKKMPFWDQVKKKVHRPKTTTTDEFPTKHTSPPTKSTTVGEHLELAEDVSYKKHHGPNTEPSLNGPIKIPQERTIHTPVKESEDDDNLWDFRVLSEEEVVTYHSKTKRPTQKKTTIFSFKPLETTADDWEIFNEPPKEEVTKPLTEQTVAEKKKTTFYVVITPPTEPSEPLEEIGESEKPFDLEPPPPEAPPGAVEQSTEYYDEEEGEESATQDYESGLDSTFPKPAEKSRSTTTQEVVAEENPDFTVGKVEDFETVTFRVSEVFVERTETAEEIGGRTEENVELVTFRPFESYPTDSAARVSESVKEVMEDLRDQNKEGFIDSLQLEQVTFRKSPLGEENGYTEGIVEVGPSSGSPGITLPETGVGVGDKENLLYVLTEKSDFDWELPENLTARTEVKKPSVAGSEGTTRIVEGDRMMTEPYDHRSMSVPFNEKLEGPPGIIKEINNNPNESPPLPPLSDLAADFLREQSSLGLNRDPYSVLERPTQEETSKTERPPYEDVLGTDEELKAPFTEENEDYATVLMEPDRLEPGASAGDESPKKSEHLLETSERYSYLEKLKKKLKNYRAKPITAGGGNEEGGNRGKEFRVKDRTTTVSGSASTFGITYPEAVEAVVAVERTTRIPEAPVSKYHKHEKHLETTRRPKDKFLELIESEGQLERAELTEGPSEEASTIPYMLTPIPNIVHSEMTTEKEFQPSSSERLISVKIEGASEEVLPSEENTTSGITSSGVELPPDIEEIMKLEHDIETTEVPSTSEIEEATSVGTTHHVVIVTTKKEEPTTPGEIERIIELQGALEEPSKIVSTSRAPVEKDQLTESPSEVAEEVLRTLEEFEMSSESIAEKTQVSATYGTDVVSSKSIDMTSRVSETTTESTSSEPSSSSTDIVDEILRTLDEFEISPEAHTGLPTKESHSIHGIEEADTEEDTETEVPETSSEIEPTTTSERPSTSADIVDEILRTLNQFEISPLVHTSLVTEKPHSTHAIHEDYPEEAPETETATEIEVSSSSEPSSTSDVVEEILRTLGQFEISPEAYTKSTTEKFHSTQSFSVVSTEEEISTEVSTVEPKTTSEIEIIESSTPLEPPSSTSDSVEEILKTLHEFEMTPEAYTESMKKELLSIPSEVIEEEEAGTEVDLRPPETTREVEVPDLLTPLHFTEEKHMPTSPISSSRTESSSEHLTTSHKFTTTPILATLPAAIIEEEESTQVTSPFLPEKSTERSSSVPEKTKTTLGKEAHIESVKEEQDEIETNLAHLPKDMHETSTICEICDQTGENEISSEKLLTEKMLEEEKLKKEKEEKLTSLIPLTRTTGRILLADDGLEEFDANLMHLPKGTHETSTICEICDEESTKEHGHLPQGSTRRQEKFEEEEVYSTKNETKTTKQPHKISHKEELEQEEFESNMHHLPENTKHETSTICEICSEEEAAEPSMSSEEKITTSKQHQVTEKLSRTTVRVKSTSEFSDREKLEQEEFESNLHHLPEPETSTICEICTEEEGENLSRTPYLSKTASSESTGHTISREETTLRGNIETVKFSKKPPGGLETTSELTNHDKLEQEEFDSNLHHLPEQKGHETSTICEICTEEGEESESGKPFSKISTTKAPAHDMKSSQSPGESDKGFGFSKELPEGLAESTKPAELEEFPKISTSESEATVIEEILETTKALTYKFEGKEVEQTMQTTSGNVFFMGQQITTQEGVTGVDSGISTSFQTERKTEKYTIEEIGLTEAVSGGEESTSEERAPTGSSESTIDEGLKAAKNIEHELEETMRLQEESESTEHQEVETVVSAEETEKSETTTEKIYTREEVKQSETTTESETYTISTSKEASTSTSEMPTETNFYTEFKSLVNMELSSFGENISTHAISTPKLEETTREMVKVLQEIERIGEESRTKTEESYEITTPSGAHTTSSEKEHTIVEITGAGLGDLEERGTTHMASDVSALLKNLEDIQEELFISTLGIKDFTESSASKTLEHKTEKTGATESGETASESFEGKSTHGKETTWSLQEEFIGTSSASSERIGMMETAGGEKTSAGYESENATLTDFYTEVPSEHFELSLASGKEETTFEYIESESESTSRLEGAEVEASTGFHTEIPSENVEVSGVAGTEETTGKSITSGSTSEHKASEQGASTHFYTEISSEFEGEEQTTVESITSGSTSEHKASEEGASTHFYTEISSKPEGEEETIVESITSGSTSEHKASEEGASTHFYTEISSEAAGEEETTLESITSGSTSEHEGSEEETSKTTHLVHSSTREESEAETATDFYTEILASTTELEMVEGEEKITAESTSKLKESEEVSSTKSFTEITEVIEGEKGVESTVESIHLQSQMMSSTKITGEENSMELSEEITTQSLPEVSTVILPSDLLSENVEKKLEELNKAVEEFLVTTPKKGSIGDLEEIKDQITENLILEKELEDLNKEFKEMMETTLSAEDLLEGLEGTSHGVVKGTLEDFEITTKTLVEETEFGITEETFSSEAIGEGTEHMENKDTIVTTEGEVAITSVEGKTPSLEEIEENKTELRSKSTSGETLTTSSLHPVSGVSEGTEKEVSAKVATENLSSTKYHTTEGQEVSTNFYTEFISESITISSSSTENFEENEVTSLAEETHHTKKKEMLTTLLHSSETALTEGVEKGLSDVGEISTFPSTKEELTEYSTGTHALDEKIKELKENFEEIIRTTESAEEIIEKEEKITEINLAEKLEEISSTSSISELEASSSTPKSPEELDEHGKTTVLEGHSEKVQSDKIDTKLDELNDIINDILNATSVPEKNVEGVLDLEEFTESGLLEKELEELNKEFEEILQTTLSSEEILEGIGETKTAGNEPKHSTTKHEEVTTGYTKEEENTLVGEESTTSRLEEITEATKDVSEQMIQGATEIEEEAKSSMEDGVVTEVEISADMESGTNFYTEVVTASETETSGEMENEEEKTTEVLASLSLEKSVTDKLEKKLEELDEIINEFLTSTPKIEIVSDILGIEEQTTEEDFEKELEELKHEFQLMMSTTISPDDLLDAVEDVLSPTTEEGKTSGGYETSSVAASTEKEVETGEKTEPEGSKGVENVTDHEGTLEEGEEMTEGGKHEETSEVGATDSEGHLEVITKGSYNVTARGEETTAVREVGSTFEIEVLITPTQRESLGEITPHVENASETTSVSHSSTSEVVEIQEKKFTEEVSEGGEGMETSGVTRVAEETVGELEGTETEEVSHTERMDLSSVEGGAHEEASTIPESTEAETSGTEYPEKKTEGTETSGTKKTAIYSTRPEKVGSTSETTTGKSHVTEGLSSISLLTTLLLSLVTSTTQTPEKSGAVSTQFAPNVSGPQNIPKCLVVFITGESPLLPLNGTKWVPSECPRSGEESTTSYHLESTTSGQESTTSIATTLESLVSENTPGDEAPSSTVTTTLVPVEELPEIRTKNYVEDGCSEADFENNNRCFCMLDLTVDRVSEVVEGGNSSKVTNVKCSRYLKVNRGLVMRNDTMASLKRSRRSYLYLKYLNRQRRETVEYNKIDEVLANELTATCTDTTIYSATGGTATIPCVYKDEVIEREHFMKYLWTADGDKTIIFSDRIREATDGALKISEVSVEDGGNYTCSINRPFGNTDSEHKHYVHQLLVIERPIFKVKSTVMYATDEACSLKDGDVVHAYLPKMLEDLLCGIHKRVCKVEMERPSCVEEEEKTYLTVKYIVTLDGISTLVPSMSASECDFNCQMKVMGSLVSLLIKNVETTSVLDVISEIQSFNHTFKPREVKFPADRTAAEDASLLPKLVIGCPSGFGIQRSTNKICVACPRNTYNSENSSICSPCPKIHYQPKLGSSSCIECKTPFDDKACVGMMFANKTFLILYVGSSIAIVFFLLLCIFCAQNSTQAAFGGTQKKKRAQTPKRRRIGRKDVEDPAEKPLLPKDPSIPKIVKGPKVPPPDF